jgi:hypothetical protein
MRGIEDQFRVTYPEIAITPIAIYRDKPKLGSLAQCARDGSFPATR